MHNEKTSVPLTPMQQRVADARAKLPSDSFILTMIRLGDFYEFFWDDAKIAAPILGVALTKRKNIPMCGFPFHAKNKYLASLTLAGWSTQEA